MEVVRKKILFVINHVSGRKTLDWESVISEHFKSLTFDIEFYQLPEKFTADTVKAKIDAHKPDYVVAVGGDGTITLVASCLRNTKMVLGILPAGSANGMAKELGIAPDAIVALDIIAKGFTRRMSLLEINDHISMHLADIGVNAYMLREFEHVGTRGFFGYLIATLKVLRRKRPVKVDVTFNGKTKKMKADIILIANATKYGTGVLVNPVGKLNDDVFEVIAINELSVGSLLNSSLRTLRVDENKTTIYQMNEVHIHSSKPVHFQVDGEYIGKVRDIRAKLLPDCLEVLVPGENQI